jgi:hypothetical protein
MQLKEALAVAAKYTGEESYRTASLRDGKVRAMNGVFGVEITCEAATIGVAVDAGALLKMLKAEKGDPAISLGKGRKLKITLASGSSYHLQAIPESREPAFPEMPTDGWADLTENEVGALAALALLPDNDERLEGMRLHPHWAAIARTSEVAVAWVQGKVSEPITVPASLFKGLSGPGRLHTDQRRAYVETEGQIRWTQAMTADYPDSVVTQVVTTARAEPGRVTVTVDGNEVAALARQALVAAQSKAHAFLLTLDGSEASLSGGADNSAYGARDYEGSISVGTSGGPVPHQMVGITPTRLALIAKIVSCARGGTTYLSANGKLQPVLMWAGDPVVIEALALPSYME